MNIRRLLPRLIGIVSILWLLVGCSLPAPAPTAVPRTVAATPTAPTPLCKGARVRRGRGAEVPPAPLLLCASAPLHKAMVDIAYFGFGGARAHGLTDLPLGERRALLNAPLLPFDGMNEQGLAVGMAAVPPGQMRPDPGKETIGSLMAIRQMLDQASNVDEAVVILESYNIDMGGVPRLGRGGPPVHYLMADPSGRAVLVEFYQGEMVVIPNETPWQQATNFLRASAGESAAGRCWRYDRVSERLAEAEGQILAQGAMGLLAEVAQGSRGAEGPRCRGAPLLPCSSARVVEVNQWVGQRTLVKLGTSRSRCWWTTEPI